MNKEDVVDGVRVQSVWWLNERIKKIRNADHNTMEVNPFMAPLVSALHGHENFPALADFLLGGHFSIGHATGFGKLIDEKILPRVFNTVKLDKSARKTGVFNKSCFNNIDHVVHKDGKDILLSLKASKWTIQLGQAVELNKSFFDIRSLYEAKDHTYDHIIIATFYGHADNLTDKYRLVRGISFGANHDVYDLQDYVTVLAGRDFWTWLGDDDQTQSWVMEGIQEAISEKQEDLDATQELLSHYRESFIERYSKNIDADGNINWYSILNETNG